jgi:FkbM family methyltransferase
MQTFLKDCRWGRFLLLRGDMISTYVDIYGEWSELEVALYRSLLQANSVVVEVGANLGMHTVPLAKLVPSGCVICFEPQRPIFQILCGNLALNNLTNVDAEHLAVGELQETVTIQTTDYETPWNYGAFSLTAGLSTEGRFPGPVGAESVSVVTLDEFPQTADLERLDLLKIDTEGFELAVLRGAQALICRLRPILFVENNNAAYADALIQHIRDLGYSPYWFCTERFQRDNYNRVGWQVAGQDTNMVCVPEGSPSIPGLTAVESFAQLRTGKVALVRSLSQT